MILSTYKYINYKMLDVKTCSKFLCQDHSRRDRKARPGTWHPDPPHKERQNLQSTPIPEILLGIRPSIKRGAAERHEPRTTLKPIHIDRLFTRCTRSAPSQDAPPDQPPDPNSTPSPEPTSPISPTSI